MRNSSPVVALALMVNIGLACPLHAGDPTVTSTTSNQIEESGDLSPHNLGALGWVDESAHPFLRDTRFFLHGRLRYEFGDLEGREDSNALTWRHRVGVETGDWLGFSVLAELEHTWDLLGEDQYNPFPRAGRTVIGDPGNVELNRLQLQYRTDIWDTALTAGRQEIMLDDQRFIGNVGWRQNEQTYDAIRLETSPAEDLTINYAYLRRVNRIFGEEVPRAALNHFESDSHLFNLRYEGLDCGNLTAFAYLLDLQEAPALSSQTYGLRFNGSSPIGGSTSVLYDLQWAVQQDYEGNPADYTAHFYRIESGLDFDKAFQLGLGYEVLGEDDGVAFQSPLGTNHKFNGFADAFLNTPASGLQDIYAWVGGKFSAGFATRLSYHHFLTNDHGKKLGDEIDLTISRKLGENTSALLKAAHLQGNGAQPDLTRVSFQIDYSF